jgi:mono/diheme cytochrome c family protein
MAFKLSKSSAIPSGKVTFDVTNQGALSHDFKICTSVVTSDARNACTGKVTKLLKHGQSAILLVTLTKTGMYEYLCTVPGHANAGMKGLIGLNVKVTVPLKTSTTPKTTPTATKPTTTKPPTTAPVFPTGNAANGPAVWSQAGCGSCHTMAAANATGTEGPNLDQLMPTVAAVENQTYYGGGTSGATMPNFGSGGTLTVQQIADVAAYVHQSTQ